MVAFVVLQAKVFYFSLQIEVDGDVLTRKTVEDVGLDVNNVKFSDSRLLQPVTSPTSDNRSFFCKVG